MNLPNFLVVGAAKSGTTSIYSYLMEHPEIFMSEIKEPRFFISPVMENLSRLDPRYSELIDLSYLNYETYEKLFRQSKHHKAVGEASATYLYYHQVSIPKIKEILGDVRIIICLRDPTDRAFSSYKHLVREKKEPRSFEKCLKLEVSRKENNWSLLNLYIDGGLYYGQVKAFLDNFSHVKVCLFDDLRADPNGFMKEIFDFLEVDNRFTPCLDKRHNVSHIRRSSSVDHLLDKPNSVKRILGPVVNAVISPESKARVKNRLRALNVATYRLKPATQRYLKETFRPDLIKLQDIIDKDISPWLN